MFVGRQAELELLELLLGRVRSGSSEVVLVSGAAGIGKTALLRRFLDDHNELVVVWCSAAAEERQSSLSTMHQLWAQCHRRLRNVERPPDSSDPLTAGANLVELMGALR